MAALTRAIRIGVIAEEMNDVEVIRVLTGKFVKENQFSFSHFVGHGCGKVRRKCGAWAKNFLLKGISHLVIIHDLDKWEEIELRKLIEDKIRDSGLKNVIVLIPVEEMEAWLLSDPKALKDVFKMRKIPKVPKFPEKINDPKEYLRDLVINNSKSQYLNTIHNPRIAKKISVPNLLRCSSFAQYPGFLMAIFPKSSLLPAADK